jgi:VWFA-related protein
LTLLVGFAESASGGVWLHRSREAFMHAAVALVVGSLLLVPAATARAADGVSGSDKVILDFVAKDKKGAVIPDLKPEEVEIEENGSRRPVESLRFVKAGEAPAGASTPGTLISLVFSGMDLNQQRRAQQAVEDLLRNDLGKGTYIAVFRIGLQLWAVQPFTNDPALVKQAVEKAASPQDQALAEPDAAARQQVADALAQLSTGNAADPAALSRAEVLGKIIRHGDRLLRQQQQDSPLYLLLAVAKGQTSAPGRKAVLYFAGGLTVPAQIDDVFKTTQSEANRAHVSFYAIDVGGLDTSSEAQSSRGALEDVARASKTQNEKTSGAVSLDDVRVDENAEASTRTNWKQPLKELSENTGGFAVIDSNDYRKAMERLAAELGGFYEAVYAPVSTTWDGAFRKTEVKVSRAGTKVDHGVGYIATPPDDSAPILAYELPLLDALKSAEPRKDFPISAGTLTFGSTPDGREVTLIAQLPMSSFKFSTDPKTKLYKLHFALLAVVKDASGAAVERVSQDYPFQGPVDKLPQLQQGNVVFKRKLVVPPGTYTLELVAQDRESAATSVYRAPLTVKPAQGLAMSSIVIVRKLEPAPPVRPGTPEDPLRGEAMRIVPSLDDPISKAATPKLPVFLIVYPAAGPGIGAPQMTLEFATGGTSEGRNAVVLPAPDPDGRIRFLAPIPIDKYAPGRHELKVTVQQGSARAEESVAFTLQP